MSDNPRIYIICGGSGFGKSLLLNMVTNSHNDELRASIPKKFTTRLSRSKSDDVKTVIEEELNKEEYTFVYAMNGHMYAYRASCVISLLKKGRNVFLIISDLRLIDEIKKFFGALVTVIYVFRNMTDKEFDKVQEHRDVNGNIITSEEIKIRRNRLYLIQRQYVENISLFDHVILNRSGKIDELYMQIKNLVYDYNHKKNGIFYKPKGPVIFLIAAASGSGKHTLIDAMYTLGKRAIKVVEKGTNRDVQPDDGKEIIPNEDIDKDYDIKYEFNNNKYGFKSFVIWDNLASGLPQILITNMDEFHQFKKIFGDSAIGVYLHATRTPDQTLKWQLKKLKDKKKAQDKVDKMEDIHKGYIKNIGIFKHVLLNTIEKEDLWEQMFRLIQYYKAN